MKKRGLCLAGSITLVVLVSLSCLGCGDTKTSDEILLRYAFFAPAESFPAVQMEWWAEEMESRTNGQVKVQTIPGGALFTAENMFDGVLTGAADIGLSFVTYEPNRFPLLSLNDLPGLGYANSSQATRAFFDVVWANQDIDELRAYQVITAFCTEPSYIQTINEYSTLESLEGVHIRTPGGPEVLEALGAVGVYMPQSEIQQALEHFLIDGIVTSREVLKGFNYAERIKFVINKPLGQVSALAVMKRDRYDALPEKVKEVINELAPLAAAYAGETLDEQVRTSLEWSIETQGVKVVELSDETSKEFDDALISLTNRWIDRVAARGLPADDFYKKLREAAAKYD